MHVCRLRPEAELFYTKHVKFGREFDMLVESDVTSLCPAGCPPLTPPLLSKVHPPREGGCSLTDLLSREAFLDYCCVVGRKKKKDHPAPFPGSAIPP